MLLCGLLGGKRGAKSRSLTGFAGCTLRPSATSPGGGDRTINPRCICRKYAVRMNFCCISWPFRDKIHEANNGMFLFLLFFVYR